MIFRPVFQSEIWQFKSEIWNPAEIWNLAFYKLYQRLV